MRSVLPLVGSATEETGVEEAIRRMEDDPELAEIARAECCYFSAQAKECVDIVKKYLDKPVINISAKDRTGIDELESKICEMFLHGQVSFNDEVYITNIRHKNSLTEAFNSLKLVVESINNDMPEDFYSIDLMNAYEELGLIIGEAVEDDLMQEIFSKFCMGK